MPPMPIRDELGDDPLADANLRVRWANDDGQAFSDLSEWFKDTGAYAVHVQHQGDRWEATWHRFIEPSVEAEKFTQLARRLGSYLDNIRAALNYATYQLALRALRDDPSLAGDLNPESVEYPIFANPDDFRQKNRIKKLPEAYRDAIEAIQPYDGQYPGLWILHELAREFRHRVVHPTGILPAPDAFHVLVDGKRHSPTDLEVIPHDRLEHGDVVMRFTLDVDPSADVYPQVAVAVGIDHVLCRELIGTGVLNQIRESAEPALDAIEAILYAP